MAVLFYDGCNWGRSAAGGAAPGPSDQDWDFGGPIYSGGFTGPNNDRYFTGKASTGAPLRKTFTGIGTVVIGFWWLPPATPVGDIIAVIRDGTNIQCQLECIPNAGKFQLIIRNGSAGGIQVTGPTLFTRIWRWVTLKIPIADVATVVCKVDGFAEFTAVGIDTRAAGGAQCTSVDWMFTASSNLSAIACPVICDTTSAVMNDVLLPQRSVVQFPTGADAGTFNDWVASAGTRTSCVDEPTAIFPDDNKATPNDDTDYVKSGTVAQKQSFPVTAVPSGITINAYRVSWRVRRDDATPRQCRAFIRNGAGTIHNFATRTIGASYETFTEQLLLSPFTGIAFTKAEIDAYQLGVEVMA